MATIGKIAANLRVDTVGLLLSEELGDQLTGCVVGIGALYALGRAIATRIFAAPQPMTAS
jgi:hypothetical protein